MNLGKMLSPVPSYAKYEEEDYFVWGGTMVRDKDGKCHLFYSRWPKDKYFACWLTHSEIAHAVSDNPTGPYKHVDVTLPKRGAEYWDGLSTYNPTIKKFGSKYYLYYTGTTGNEKFTKSLNWTNRNMQQIGVVVADHPNGPWKRFDKPILRASEDADAHDALMVSNPAFDCNSDGKYVMMYKAVAKKKPLPFGGPVVHMIATSDSPTGPFVKENKPLFTVPGEMFPAEDPYMWSQDGYLWAIVKDHSGKMAVDVTGGKQAMLLFKSKKGINWTMAAEPLVTTYEVNWADKPVEKIFRFERPQLWLDENGVPKVLFCCGVDKEYKHSFNVHIPLNSNSLEK